MQKFLLGWPVNKNGSFYGVLAASSNSLQRQFNVLRSFGTASSSAALFFAHSSRGIKNYSDVYQCRDGCVVHDMEKGGVE